MFKKCVRCGEEVKRRHDLWCDYCRWFVDEELKGEKERPRDFYFHWYMKNATTRDTKRVRQQD